MYECSDCGKVTEFSRGGYKIECTTCGGWLQEQFKESKADYRYVCASCGYRWQGKDYREKQCPNCGTLDIICTYKDNGMIINEEWYNEIIANAQLERQFQYKCPKCDSSKYLYSGGLYGIACNKCFELLQVKPDEHMLDKLKNYRKRKGWTQEEMGKRYGLSQAQYSKIESGLKPIPFSMLKLVKN